MCCINKMNNLYLAQLNIEVLTTEGKRKEFSAFYSNTKHLYSELFYLQLQTIKTRVCFQVLSREPNM